MEFCVLKYRARLELITQGGLRRDLGFKRSGQSIKRIFIVWTELNLWRCLSSTGLALVRVFTTYRAGLTRSKTQRKTSGFNSAIDSLDSKYISRANTRIRLTAATAEIKQTGFIPFYKKKYFFNQTLNEHSIFDRNKSMANEHEYYTARPPGLLLDNKTALNFSICPFSVSDCFVFVQKADRPRLVGTGSGRAGGRVLAELGCFEITRSPNRSSTFPKLHKLYFQVALTESPVLHCH